MRPPHRGDGTLLSARYRSQGMALVLVLAFLVLITSLIIAFLSNVTTEHSGAKGYADGARSKQLADSAAQIAIGAIQAATSHGVQETWASQPGMIRVYDQTGAAKAYYKLYSSDTMVVSDSQLSAFTPGVSDVNTQWSTKPALYTDLNSPVVTGNTAVFPILDGNAIRSLSKNRAGTSVPAYLGYDADQDGLPDIEGFSIDPSKVTYSPGSAISVTNTPVPMPTKWLYVLQDGTVTVADDTSSTTATFDSAPASKRPSASNPITGRIAFWTDDDTCKVNVNTASEGTYMDMPRFLADEDMLNLSLNQPMNKEFQRYPGHPAMTSLSVVFPTLSANQIYAITPRVVGGGSQGGTVQTVKIGASTIPSLSLDSDRLYATIDELIFAPTLSGTTRSLQGLTQEQLARGRFFLTANSRAPDVNLFNKPRVCIWPLSSSTATTDRSVFDQQIAFCSTVNGYKYFFQRSTDPMQRGSESPTLDLPLAGSVNGLGRNRMLMEYLRYLTSQPIPGFGGNFQSKYNTKNSTGASDCDQILTGMFDYIRSANLYDTRVANPYAPGDSVKLGQGQVIPIFDQKTGTKGFGRFPTVSKAFIMFIGNAENSPSLTPPITMNAWDAASNPTGVKPGNIRVQAGLFLEFFDPSRGFMHIYPKFQVKIDGLNNFHWGPVTDPATPMVPMKGFPSTATFKAYPSGAWKSYPFTVWDALVNETFVGGLMGWAPFVASKGSGTLGTSSQDVYPFIAATETASDFPVGGKFNFSGGTITVTILDNQTPANEIQKLTIDIPSSPAAGWPVPNLPPVNTVVNLTSPRAEDGGQVVYGDFRTFVGPNTAAAHYGGRLNARGDLASSGQRQTVSWILGKRDDGKYTDVVRSVEVADGDTRLVAAQASVPSSYFARNINYDSPSNFMAHSLRTAMNYPYYGATPGKLLPINPSGYVTYPQTYSLGTSSNGSFDSYRPYSQMQVAYDFGYRAPNDAGVRMGGGNGTVLGDWDNGFGYASDGPYINKVDEGDGRANSTSTPYYQYHSTSYDTTMTLFSPNRQIPSAVAFGSLPSEVFANKPWQTLLFRPLPQGHRGLGTPVAGPPFTVPPDYLLLDLFSMPVVEPYPISEPLSTAGRINMNYQIVPFTYINRDTGIRAVLKSEKVIAVADSDVTRYKSYSGNKAALPVRYPVNAEETLKGFTERFSRKDIFRSAAEICGISLVPNDPNDVNATYTGMSAYWLAHRPTGDNSRERPYATIYPRLTTKSNTYTVHFRVQTLKKSSRTDTGTWVEGKDLVTSEYRGSQVIERYIDPADKRIPDYASASVYSSNSSTTDPTLDSFYRFRVLSAKRFSP